MTAADKPRFVQCFTALAVALRLHDAEIDEFQQGVYFNVLADLPIDAIEASVPVLQRSAGSFFPTTAEWYRVADDMAAEQLIAAGDGAVPALPPAGDDELYRTRRARDRMVEAFRAWGWTKPADRFAQLRIRVPRPHWCATCQDAGWKTKTCPDDGVCGRPDCDEPEAGSHTYAKRCGCASQNPVIAARCAEANRRQTQRTKTRMARG